MAESTALNGPQSHPMEPERAFNRGTDNVLRRKNARRIELIEREGREGLSTAEQRELAVLRCEISMYVDEKHPLPPIDSNQLDNIEVRLAESRSPVPG